MRAVANPIFTRLPQMSGAALLLFFGKTVLQLFGEELLTIQPLLAVLTLLHGRGVSRRWSIFAWILFGVVMVLSRYV